MLQDMGISLLLILKRAINVLKNSNSQIKSGKNGGLRQSASAIQWLMDEYSPEGKDFGPVQNRWLMSHLIDEGH